MSEWNRGYDRGRYGRNDDNAYHAEGGRDDRGLGERRDFGGEEYGGSGSGAHRGYGGGGRNRGMFRGQGGYEGERYSGGSRDHGDYGREAFGAGTPGRYRGDLGGYGGGYGGQGYESHPYGGRGYSSQGYGAEYGRFAQSQYGDARSGEMGQHRGRGPKNYTRSDERIEEDVNDRLSDDSWIDASEVEVTVDGGEVTLSGTVQTRQDKHRAEDLAEQCSGVKNVQNNLRVQSPQAGDQGSASRAGDGQSSTAQSGAASATRQ